MGSGGSKSKFQKTSQNKYIRFGEIPAQGVSLNYFKLSSAENQDITYDLSQGDDILTAISRNVKDYEKRDLFESGVSVFKANNNMPVIENLQQLNSLLNRLDKSVYSVYGYSSGLGADNEPIVSNISKSVKLNIDKQKINTYISNFLKSKYKNIEKVDYEDTYVSRDEVIFNKLRYSNPVSNWNTSLGYSAYNYTDSGYRLQGGTKYVNTPVKNIATNVSYFKSKSGKDMVRYSLNGKEYTDTTAKFNSRTTLQKISNPLKIIKIKGV